MHINILSLFPAMFSGPLTESMIKRAIDKDILNIDIVNPRDYSTDKHHHVDDVPFGGDVGMLLKPEPFFAAMEDIKIPGHVIAMVPGGKVFNQKKAYELAQYPALTILCGHYEGFDQRILDNLVDECISVGDFVLTGGELPAMLVIDAVARMIPGVLGSEESASRDSFYNGLLKYPQYTRPRQFRNLSVPEVLLSGNHQNIATWRRREMLRVTYENRPDLLEKTVLTEDDYLLLAEIKNDCHSK